MVSAWRKAGLMNLPARVVLFVSSYVPLGGLYFLLYVGKDNRVAYAAAAVAALSAAALWLLLWSWKRDVHPTRDDVLEFRKPGAEVMGYIASYLLPFLGFSLDSRRHLAVLAAYLVILGFVYVTTDMIRVNPTMSLLGYGLYEADLKEYGSVWLVARRSIRRGDQIRVAPVSHDLVIQTKIKSSDSTRK